MIDNGCGIITIAQENQPIFFEKLIKYYETNNNKDLAKELLEDQKENAMKRFEYYKRISKK